MRERYLLPFMVGVAGAIALALAAMRQHPRLRVAWPLAVLALAPALGRGVSSTVALVEPFVAETKAFDRMVRFLAENVPPHSAILMAGDSGTAYGFEATYALPMYLTRAGSTSPFYLWPLVSSGERSPAHIAALRDNTAFKYPDTLTPDGVGAVVIVDKWVPTLDIDPLVRWLGDTRWREVTFAEPYTTFSWRRPGYAAAGSVRHRALLSVDGGAATRGHSLLVVDRPLAAIISAGPVLDGPP
ncbi:MAG: hypothetical protein FJW27_01260 [Acidimicrobiia bacterium]|nr:hypothetical protein [Acidimicrobiia bacterium]